MTPHPHLHELRGGGDPYADLDDYQDPAAIAEDIYRTVHNQHATQPQD